MTGAAEASGVVLVPWQEFRDAVLSIELPETQRRFISGQSVAEFLADDDEHPTFASFAVCHGEAVVGLLCLGREPHHDPWKRWIPLLVVDSRHQGNGYARAAMRHIIGALREDPGCRLLGLSCAADNRVALHLYESLGFEPGATNSRGELEMWLELPE